jgi:protease-4
MIVSLVLFVLLLLVGFLWMGSMVGSLMGGAGPHRSAGPAMQEMVVEQADTADKILLVKVDGVISGDVTGRGNLPSLIREQFKRAERDRHIKAVILYVDSPGGEVLASDEIAQVIEKFQKDSGKPVIASMQNVAASGGYYVSAPCRWIVANELTITGSIGVIMHAYNYRGLMDKVGFRPEVYKSGKYKDMLSPDREASEITPEERAMVQNLVDTTFARFKAVVRKGRTDAAKENENNSESGRTLNADWESYADGRILSGQQAYEIGLVDEVGNLQTAQARARTLAGISEASLVEYQPLFDLSNFFRLLGRAPSTRIEVNLGTELPKLKTGRLYFLAPSFLK